MARHRRNDMSAMYRAIQVTKPGKFEAVMKPLVDPGPGQVRIRVEACGVCHSDSGTVEAAFPISWPRVPGHEVVGRIDAIGSGVQGWAVGQRVPPALALKSPLEIQGSSRFLSSTPLGLQASSPR
jgi:D-arabinose 1-dehydrogenase-like Zn-dependent alcohol dehydrogenase